MLNIVRKKIPPPQKIVLFKVRSKIKSHNQNYTPKEGEEGLMEV
jgi:hypothetical protein